MADNGQVEDHGEKQTPNRDIDQNQASDSHYAGSDSAAAGLNCDVSNHSATGKGIVTVTADACQTSAGSRTQEEIDPALPHIHATDDNKSEETKGSVPGIERCSSVTTQKDVDLSQVTVGGTGEIASLDDDAPSAPENNLLKTQLGSSFDAISACAVNTSQDLVTFAVATENIAIQSKVHKADDQQQQENSRSSMQFGVNSSERKSVPNNTAETDASAILSGSPVSGTFNDPSLQEQGKQTETLLAQSSNADRGELSNTSPYPSSAAKSNTDTPDVNSYFSSAVSSDASGDCAARNTDKQEGQVTVSKKDSLVADADNNSDNESFVIVSSSEEEPVVDESVTSATSEFTFSDENMWSVVKNFKKGLCGSRKNTSARESIEMASKFPTNPDGKRGRRKVKDSHQEPVSGKNGSKKIACEENTETASEEADLSRGAERRDPFPHSALTLQFTCLENDHTDDKRKEVYYYYPYSINSYMWLHFLSEKVERFLAEFVSGSSSNFEGDTVVVTVPCFKHERQMIKERLYGDTFAKIQAAVKRIKCRKYTLDKAQLIQDRLKRIEKCSPPFLVSILSQQKQRLLIISEDPEAFNEANKLILRLKEEYKSTAVDEQGLPQGTLPSEGVCAASEQLHDEEGTHMTDKDEQNLHGQKPGLVTNHSIGNSQRDLQYQAQQEQKPNSDQYDGKEVSVPQVTPQRKCIPLERPLAAFLRPSEVLKDFIAQLNSVCVCIDAGSLEKENTLILTQGSPQKLKEVLQTFMYMIILSVLKGDPEVTDILEQLKESYGNFFYYQFEHDKDILTIVCRGEDRDKILPKTEQLVWVEKHVPLPAHVMKYMVSRLPVLQQQMKTRFPNSEVNITIESIEDQEPTLMVKAERKFFPNVRKVLDKVLAKLWCLQMRTEVELDLSLKPREGEADAMSTPNESDVSVHVQVPGHGLLLKAKSPQDHQFLVYEGNILATDCHVIVLPLYEGRKDQSAMHQWVLKKGLFSMDPARYGASLKPPESSTITLHCQSDAADTRHVILMHVPPRDSGKFRDYIELAVQDAMRSAMSLTAGVPTSSIALPLTLSAKGNDWKCVLPAVMKVLTERTEAPVTVKLYLDETIDNRTAAAETISDVNEHLSNPTNNWMTDTFCRVEFPLKSRINIIIEDICSQIVLEQTDVLVNTTDPKLHLTASGVSSKISEAGGDGLKKECGVEYRGGIGDHLVAVTGSHGLKPVKEVFHIVLLQDFWTASKEQALLDSLQARMVSCLLLASSKGHQKITFPTLGTGNLKYPPDKVANVMFATAEDFFALMPHSCVQDVNIVCYPEAKSVIKSFKEKERISMASQQLRANDGLSHQSGRGEVMAIVGVCGSERAVETKIKKIRMQALEVEQVQAASGASVEGGSDVDPPGYGGARAKSHAKKNVKTTESTSEEKDLCHFTLPQRLFTVEHLSVLADSELMTSIQNLETVDKPGPSKRFTVPASCLLPVVTEVMKLINQPPEQRERSSQGTKRQAGEQQKTMNMPRHNYLALISLMRKEFESMFTVLNEDGDQVTIACKEPSPPQQVIDRMQSLRREEVQIPKEEAMKLGQPFNTVSEGVDAFILPLPDEEKVIIFSFEYNNLSKAKHLVNVRIGKVKVTTRSRRRFDGTGPDSGGSITDQSPPSSLRSTSPYTMPGAGAATSEVVFTTKSGIKVSVYKTDITKLPVDAIVNAANEHLNHGGGVAFAISKAAGFELEEEGDAYIRKHGPLKVTEVGVTSAGSLTCKKVLHAVGPRWTDYKDKLLCQKDLTITVFNCLKTATELGLSSLAVSSISSAIFGVPKEVCAESYLSAVHGFDDQYGGSSSIEHVHFVDVNDTMVDMIGRTFSQKWDKPISIAALQVPVNAYNREEAKTRQWNTERSAGTQTHRDMISTRGNAHTEQINQTASGASSDYSRPPTRVNSDFNLSDPGSKSTHESGAGSSHLGGTTANRAESQLRETKELQKGARGLEPRGSEQRPQSQGITPSRPQIETIAPGGEAQYQVHFGDLDLILQRQNITYVVTDFIVLWQSYGSVLQDVHSQNVIKREGYRFKNEYVPLLKDKLQKGEMVVHSCGPHQHLLLQIIDAASAVNREELGQIIQNMLEKVQSMGRTVVMPALKMNKASSFTTAQFAAGMSLAIRKHMERSPRPVTEVHIVDSDGDYLKDLAEAFKAEISLDMSSRQPEQGRNGENLKRSMGPKCPVCLDTLKQPTSLDKCGHTFCTDCIASCFERKPVCPECQTIYGIVYGDQPKDGRMKMKRKSFSLPTYKEPETFVIEYEFPNGIRSGSQYRGTSRTAFLPNTVEGRKVLMLLKTAFDRGLVFTVGQSATISSEELRVTWNGIHHKTDKNEGADYGYPDPTYLNRVQEELAARGVTLQDLTSTQTQFIHTPERFYSVFTPHGDFGERFDQKQKNPPWK